MTGIAELGSVSDLWEYWGFSPWSAGGLQGVYRRVTFVKSSLIGEVCRYYADDYIVWRHSGRLDRDRVLKEARPQPDLMTQRYLFVEEIASGEKGRVKSFFLGFRGYVEVHCFAPGGKYDRRVKDLAPLVDNALKLLLSRGASGGGEKKEN